MRGPFWASVGLFALVWGAALVLPVIGLYTVLAWQIFRGKARPPLG